MQVTEPEFVSLVPTEGFDPRRFLMTATGAGFALATQPTLAQTTVVTTAEGLQAGVVSVPVKGGQLTAYRAAPLGVAKPPVVLVVPEIFGMHEHIRDVCRRLAKEGYFAMSAELFARQGDPAQMTSIPEILDKITNKTPDAEVLADLDACVAWAAAQGADAGRLAITGFCWGGRITWLYAAHNPAVKAGVAWYGKLVGPSNAVTPRHPTELVGELKAPVLGLYGGEDAGIPQDTVTAMQVALHKGSPAAQASQIHVYPGAPHAFHADYRPSYRPAEAKDGWQRMLAWFRRNGV